MRKSSPARQHEGHVPLDLSVDAELAGGDFGDPMVGLLQRILVQLEAHSELLERATVGIEELVDAIRVVEAT
jgi:hypothetical protein